MHFSVIGWNFRNTPVEIRDSLALTPEQQVELGHQLKGRFDLGGVAILSTCNRTELYLVNAEEQLEQIIEQLESYWKLYKLRESVYTIHNLAGVKHLFRVASSLDSMVLGEPQILGQLKDTFHTFNEAGLTGKLLHPLFTRSFSTAKRVRTETTLASNAVSISYAAVELAKHIFEDLSKQTVMVIGAGEMAELAVRHLMRNGISQLFVTNRTFLSAAKLAEKFQGLAVPFEHLKRHLHQADIIISSTGARDFIITSEMVKQSLRQRKGNSMFFIDIAVPRDVDPEINELNGTYCYDIDDLQAHVSQNQQERKKQSFVAEEIIEEEILEVELWFKSLSAVPTIRSLRRAFHSKAEEEMEKAFRRMKNLPASEQKEIEQFVHRLIHKLLHDPSHNLKQIAHSEDAHLYLESVKKIFDLKPQQLNLEENPKKYSRLKIVNS
ncbi:MAG: glutamyl-tRNA reductase [SAR324 cluster bacterium]|nr:glutamyl-tRNA reductase [SAR324 cluster bacterium]MBL7035190.1 glutamyl-tRNA reductase [SAR324 cluster bacterium]